MSFGQEGGLSPEKNQGPQKPVVPPAPPADHGTSHRSPTPLERATFSSPEVAFKRLDSAVAYIKASYQSSQWGTPDGLKRAARDPVALIPAHTERLTFLEQRCSEAMAALQTVAHSDLVKPELVIAILRKMVFSDSFLVPLYVTTRVALHQDRKTDGEALLKTFESAVHAMVSKVREEIVDFLEDYDHDKLVEPFEMIASDLESSDSDPSESGNARIATVLQWYPSVYEALQSKDHLLKKSVESWGQERAEFRATVDAISKLLASPQPPSAGGNVSSPPPSRPPQVPTTPPVRPATPPAPSPRGTAAETTQAPTVRPTPPPPAQPSVQPPPPRRPGDDIPKGSLLDEIEGADEIGKEDTRSSRPVHAGNKGVSKEDSRSQFWKERDAKAAQKEADRAKRMADAGVKPLPGQGGGKKGKGPAGDGKKG